MAWSSVYDQNLQVIPQEGTLPPISPASLPDLTGKELLIYAVSDNAPATWWLALRISIRVAIADSPIAGLTTTKIFDGKVQLATLTTVPVPPLAELYTVVLEIPEWIGQLHVQVWQNTTPILLVRRAGSVIGYTGNRGDSVGFLDDVDGKWVYLTLNGLRTIGSGNSSADIRYDWTQNLFTHLWTQYDNARCPLLTSGGSPASRGASAASDWGNNRRITLPDFRGHILMGAGTGTGFTARAKGERVGSETHTLTAAQIPSLGVKSGPRTMLATGNALALELADTTVALSTSTFVNATGGGQSHPNIQPSAVEHLLISAGSR